MDIQALKSNLLAIIALRDKVEALSSSDSHHGYQLSDYAEKARTRIYSADHGDDDWYFLPQWDAGNRFRQLQENGDARIDSAFATSKTKLLSILNRYIKDLQTGFREHDPESGSVPPA